jgi:hypothetical protein
MKSLLNIPGAKWLWSMKNEILIGIVLLVAFANFGGCAREVDPTAASLDFGVVSFIALAVVGIVAFVILFWVLWRFCFPSAIDNWFDQKEGFLHDFFNTSPAVRLSLFFGSLWAVIMGGGMILAALL